LNGLKGRIGQFQPYKSIDFQHKRRRKKRENKQEKKKKREERKA